MESYTKRSHHGKYRYAKHGIKIGLSVRLTSFIRDQRCNLQMMTDNIIAIVQDFQLQGIDINYTTKEIADECQDFVRGKLLSKLRYREGFFVSEAREFVMNQFEAKRSDY